MLPAMPRPSHHHVAIRQVADAQADLITAAQLAEIGVSRTTTSRLSAPGGMWTRVLPGVHLVTGGTPDRHQRELAALLYAGAPGALTSTAALRHFGLRSGRLQETATPPRAIEEVVVLIPHRRRRVSTAWVRVERTRRYPPESDLISVDDVLLVPPARALADAARRMRSESDVTALVIEGIRRELWTADQLLRELDDGSRRGSAHLRTALGMADAGIWSPSEGGALRIIEGTGLPAPLWNQTILTQQGQFVGIPDAWFDEVALAVEVDSEEHHADGDGWRRTLMRQQRYARAGILCVPLTPRQITREPDEVARAIIEGYAAAAARPRPPVRIGHLTVTSTATPRTRWGG